MRSGTATLVTLVMAAVACAQPKASGPDVVAPEPRWQTESVPSRTGEHDKSELSTVVTAAGSVWALGTWDAPVPNGGRPGGALAYQRGPDGQWHEHPVPYRYRVKDSAARGTDDIWAAVSPGYGPNLHFDGDRWSDGTAGAPTGSGVGAIAVGEVEELAEIGGQVWGAGRSVMVWDGATWAGLDQQPPYPLRLVSGIGGSSPRDVWVAARDMSKYYVKVGSPVVAHYDGARWTDTVLPPIDNLWYLNDIASTGPDDAWAIGQRSQQEYAHPLVLHYDGHQWSEQELPFTRGYLTKIALIGGRPWAVGVSYDDPVTLVLRLGPEGWERVPGTPVGEAQDITALPDGRPLVVGTVPVGDNAALPLAARPEQ
jgi:hypothetical protein